MRSYHSVARRLPDLPRWVEVRDLLVLGCCEVFELREEPELSLVIRDPDTGTVFVVGRPAASAIRAAAGRSARGGEVVAPPEAGAWVADALPEWTRTRAILHVLRHPDRLPPPSAGEVGFLDPDTLPRLPISAELRRELEIGAARSVIAAAFADGQPFSFCYAGAVTESLWDIAIDTVPEHRRRGHAARCVAHMIRHMQAGGRQPVWGAAEHNPASWRLAQKIGFEPVDELALFEHE